MDIQKAAKLMIDGGVVAFPTDTVYGLGAHFLKEEAITRIYEIKGRSDKKPLQLILSDVSEVDSVAREVPNIFWDLAKQFLPGGITLVLKKAEQVPSSVTSGMDTVAIRVPNNRLALDLVRAVGAPIAATSANLSGRPSATSAQEVLRELGSYVDAIVDGGPTQLGRDSTVLDLTSSSPKILREGAVGFDLISAVCSDLQRQPQKLES